MGPPPRPTKDPATYAVPKTALETDGLDVRESATEISSPLLTLCGTQVENDSTARRHRVVTKSTSGASRLEQDIAVFAGNAARSHVENAKCAAEKIATLPTGQTGWCEPKAGGRGACMVLVAGEDVVVSLKLETISVQRAREVVTRLAAATPVK